MSKYAEKKHTYYFFHMTKMLNFSPNKLFNGPTYDC